MRLSSLRLWLAWSWRDLRRRWLLVTTLALVTALGAGVFAGLGGTSAWRVQSNDESYRLLRMHDVRVRLPEGAFVEAGALERVVAGLEDASSVQAVVERLVTPTLVAVAAGDEQLLVPGEVVGMAVGRAPVDALFVTDGRGLGAGDLAGSTAVLESKFADAHDLPSRGRLTLGAGVRVDYVGTGYTPEYFQVVGRSGMVLGETGFAVLFMPLDTAQRVTAHEGQVNDLVLRLRPGADPERVRRQLTAAVTSFGGAVTTRSQDPVHRALYEDARNDQATWNAFAFLILFGAGFAAFNLVTRMIESQRREIGVGMALGVPPRVLALRPLLVAAQISLLGVAAGVGVGWATGRAMAHTMATLLPLPVWETPFQLGRFVEGAALGLAVPLVATVGPVIRALRMEPVDAIRSTSLAEGRPTGRLLRVVARLPLPESTHVSMAVRNVVRAPRRTLLTALGVGAAITSFVAVLGLLDTFGAARDASAGEQQRRGADRLVVTLDTFQQTGSPLVHQVAGAADVEAASAQLSVPVTLDPERARIEVVLRVIDLENPIWSPTLVDDTGPATGLVISRKAADDLAVDPGDVVTVRHPRLGPDGVRIEATRVPVRAVHPDPWRTFAYLDTAAADGLGLAGVVNQVVVLPAGDPGDLRRELFAVPGVTAIESAANTAEALDSALDQFTGILRVIEVATLLLAMLIAFNTASISADERAREHATMFAFGLPQRAVLGIAVAESAVVGLVGTLAGLAGGFAGLSYIVSGFDQVTPELLVEPTLSASTIAVTLALGVGVVALAPLLGARRERHLDIPAALRVVE
ncbi:MAG: ABC transporter permease [Nocardioidaceae bacterium]